MLYRFRGRPSRCAAVLACPIHARSLLPLLSGLATHTLADRGGDDALALVAAMQIDQGGPSRRVVHAVYQLAQRGTGVGGELVASVPQVVEMHSWQLKDVDLAVAAGGGNRLPLLEALSRQWHAAVEAGHGRQDVSAARLALGGLQ